MLSCENLLSNWIVAPLATAVRSYLREILGVEVPNIEQWARADEQPYFLRKLFDFGEFTLLGHRVVLAFERNKPNRAISEIRSRIDKLSGQPTLR